MSVGTTPRPARAADRWWTLMAPRYDRCVAVVGWHRWQDEMVADVARGSVLEIGCGPGHLAKGLLARGVDYVGLDRNAAMATRAGSMVATRGPGRGAVVRADVAAMPFPAGSFDVVISTGVLGLLTVSARRVALREMVRVSRGDVRLLEPFARTGTRSEAARSRIVAFVRDRPITFDELVAVGLEPEMCGPAVLAGVYSAVRATVGPGPATDPTCRTVGPGRRGSAPVS